MKALVRTAVITVVLAFGFCRSVYGASSPFVITASSGPMAGAHVVATVTRTVAGKPVTLPAALVPALEPGDIVNLGFPDYRQPPNPVRYHVNVAFITESAPQHWLFAHSGPADRLFTVPAPRKSRARPVPAGTIRFTYGSGNARGIPIVFIIPEDAKTRGVDGVRDYVDSHPTDFVSMSQSSNDAVDQYSFLRDFLSSLGSGAFDPTNNATRIETLAQSVGVSPATIDACYTSGYTAPQTQNCVQQSVNAVVYQTNFNAPTQAQFLGGVAGAANPVALAPYVASLLTVWRIFVRTGHLEYEYLPTTLALAGAPAGKGDELLMGPKVPTIRPPGAYSDVLFFTIGDPKAAETPPAIQNTAPATGVCERTGRFTLPLAFARTSTYLHDTALHVVPDGRTPYAIPFDPHALAPVIDRSRFAASADGGYTVSLSGRFGFDPIAQPVNPTLRLAFPGNAPWSVAPAQQRGPVSGGTLDLIATSAAAPCLSHAALQIGSAPPVELNATPLDAHRVHLQAALSGVPAGPAQLRFYEDDTGSGRTFASTLALTIAPQPAHVTPASAVAAIGDAAISLAGSGFDGVRALRVNGATYAKTPQSQATLACFSGPPLAGANLTAGAQLPAQLVPADGSAGEVFALTLAAPRPDVRLAPAPAPPGPQLSTQPLRVDLQAANGALPANLSLLLRRAPDGAPSPCDGVRADADAIALPASDVHLRDASNAEVDFRPDVLADRAFGTLQLRAVDRSSGTASGWLTLPGTFARAPQVTAIACGDDPAAPCRMYGTELNAIDAVRDGSLAFVKPGLDCPPTAKGAHCVLVPHVAHYVVRLADGGVLDALPDELLGPAPS